MSSSSQRPRLALAIALGLASGACATASDWGGPEAAASPPAALLAAASAHGLPSDDPLAIDPAMVEAARRELPVGPAATRTSALVAYLLSPTGLGFRYDASTPGRSLGAREAFLERRGDCVSFAYLFVALARGVGLDARFLHVALAPTYFERGGLHLVSYHIAAGVPVGDETLVVDVAGAIRDWRLAYYEPIDDGHALALYYSNMAAADLLAGRDVEAERLTTFWHRARPDVAELYANLGVVLMRHGLPASALAVLRTGIARFERYSPLYTNAITAAREAGQPAVAAAIERAGRESGERDPFFLYASGFRLFADGRFEGAVRELERAHARLPGSATIHALLTRAYLRVGRRDDALQAYADLKREDLDGLVTRRLEAEEPALRTAAPDSREQ